MSLKQMQALEQGLKQETVAQDLAKAVAAVVQGTHEITSVTIKPKREWQGLTDEEVKAVIASIDPNESYMPPALKQFARAIEAKLKEKNQ